MNKKHVGPTLRSLFEELGEDLELELLTRKKVLTDQIIESMQRMKLSKAALATAMKTSRTLVYRLLDPKDTGVTIETLVKAERALDLRLELAFAQGNKSAVARGRAAAARKAPTPKKKSSRPAPAARAS